MYDQVFTNVIYIYCFDFEWEMFKRFKRNSKLKSPWWNLDFPPGPCSCMSTLLIQLYGFLFDLGDAPK